MLNVVHSLIVVAAFSCRFDTLHRGTMNSQQDSREWKEAEKRKQKKDTEIKRVGIGRET